MDNGRFGRALLSKVQNCLDGHEVGGDYFASGDVNGDTDALGQPVTFTATVCTSASDYSGSHVIYQDVFIPAV